MKSFNKSFRDNDELYTPRKLVDLILPYVPKSAVVWCPFDTKESEFVTGLRESGISVVHSHIWDGLDFFEYQPTRWDIAISNPPFSKKKQVFERLFKLGKPFAMVMNIMALNYQEIGELFVKNPVQLLIPDKKVSFDGNTSSFCSGYVCKDFLPKDLIFAHMADNNAGKYFIESRMMRVK